MQQIRLFHLFILIAFIVILVVGCESHQPDLPTTVEPTQLPEILPTLALILSPTLEPSPISTLPPPVESGAYKNDMGPVYSHDCSPDGNLIAVAGFSQVKIWEVETETLVKRMEGHTSYVWGVSWSPDGTALASASQDGTVRIWDTKTLSETTVLVTGWTFCVDWSPDSNQLAIGKNSGVVQIWDMKTMKRVKTFSAGANTPIISVGWSPDRKVITAGYWSGEITLWEAESGKLLNTLRNYTTSRCDVNGLIWSPESSKFATAHQDGKVRIWDPLKSEPILVVDAHKGWVRRIAWSPDGQILISSGSDKRTVLWDAASSQLLTEISDNFLPIWSVAWSPDGKYFTSGSGAYEEKQPGVVIRWSVMR